MVITWYGQACFKIQSGELVIAIDPFAKEIGLTPPRFRADFVLITHSHRDHANQEAIGGEPFVITGPGEYEMKGVYVRGIATFHDTEQGMQRGMNTIYGISVEELSLVHLGDFGEYELREETLDAIGNVDVLMIPVGGVYTIDGKQAARVVRQLSPRYVIPMHYKIPGLTVGLETAGAFLKEMGVSHEALQEKLALKKKDIGEEEKTEVVILKTG